MLFWNQNNHIEHECNEGGSIANNLTHPDKSGLPNLIAHLVVCYHRKDFDSVLEHLTSDCLLIGASSDVSHGAERIAEIFRTYSSMPTHLVREARFYLIDSNNPFEAIVVGFYKIYSDADHKMLSSEIRRLTVNCRWEDGSWKAYLVHTSNEWEPIDDDVSFPVKVSKQTYRYVQDILRASKLRDEYPVESVALPIEDGTTFINPAHIVYAEAKAKKTIIHLVDRTITVKLLLANVMDLLPGQFMRIHRSFIVNRSHISALIGGEAVMSNGDRIPIPKRRRSEIESRLVRRA